MGPRKIDIRSRLTSALKNRKKTRRLIASRSRPSIPSPVEPKIAAENEDIKPRRRRVDASDYIRRRFLYEDDASPKHSASKASHRQKRYSDHGSRARGSTAALMAASSANFLQRKRKRTRDDSLSPSTVPPIRSRRGRKPKPRAELAYSRQHLPVDDYSSVEEHDSATDEQTFSDDGVDHGLRGYTGRNNEMGREGSSGDFLKPLFRKASKRSSYKQDASFSPEELQNPPDYMPDLPEFFLNDHMTDLTRSRGPVVLSKRARHRIIPRPSPSRPDFMKHLPEYTGREFSDFGIPDADEPFRHTNRSSFALDQLVPSSDMRPPAADGSSEWGPGAVASTVVVGGAEPPKPQPMSVAVDVEDFAGDLMPQRPAVIPFTTTSGSSRRKSPVRPMQVLRNEPLIYHSESAGTANVSSAGAALIQQKQMTPSSFAQPISGGPNAGLVELCAAAGLESTTSGQISTSEVHTSAPAVNLIQDQPQQHTIISPQPTQFSLLNSNIVSLQPGGQMFVDAGARPTMTGYTVSPGSAPISRISIVPGRYSYGPPLQTTGRIPNQSLKASSSTSSSSAANATVRRRPTILKRGGGAATPTPTPTSQLRKAAPAARSVRALPLISPSVTPRLPPPFMRAALRGSPIHQQPTQTVTYAIVSTPTAVTNTASVVSVAPAVRQPLPGPQTASSRLFGPRRVEQQRPAAPSGQSTALTLISCLPSTTVAAAAPGSTGQQATPVRYAVVRGASDGKKYVLLGGSSALSVAGYKTPLQSIDPANTGDANAQQQQEESFDNAFFPQASTSETPSNQNLPPEQPATVVS